MLAFLSAIAISCSDMMENYEMDGGVSPEVLDNYLSRAVTQGEFLLPQNDGDFQENLRMLKNIGAKYIGRAAFEWTPVMDNEEHFAKVARYAELAHQADPEFMLQCCIFEAVFRSDNKLTHFGLDLIPIPEWVFEEFGLKPEKRNFNYEAMLYPDGKYVDHWAGGASVPDITQLETQMYFFYRAARYIDAGIESIHLGQVELMNMNDKSNETWFGLVARMRKYAKTHARRHYVLFDGHVPTHGIVSDDGHLLFDFHSFPFRPVDICGRPYETELKPGHIDCLIGKSKGGITPSGWKCEHLPYLLELDNSGCDKGYEGRCDNPSPWWPWGWDEITWFSHCSKEYRDYWLEYATEWLAENDPAGHCQMPGRTTIAADPIQAEDGHLIRFYRINTPSPACPDGFGQEDKVKAMWKN